MARINALVETLYTVDLERHIHAIVDALEYRRDILWDRINSLSPGHPQRRALERKAQAIESALEVARKVEG